MNKIALITGASRGIGYALAKKMLKEGFYVIGTSRNGKIEGFESDNFYSLKLDLSNTSTIKNAHDEIIAKFNHIDVLINNAGYALYGMSHNLAMEKELNMLELNIIALYKLTRLFLADMMKRDSGAIINISSNTSFQPVPKMALYAATKAFVSHYSQALNEELKMSNSKVKVITVCPAAIKDTKFKKAANMVNTKAFEGITATNKKEVAKDVWKAYKNNKTFIMSGAKLRLVYPIIKLIPKSLINVLLKNELSEKK